LPRRGWPAPGSAGEGLLSVKSRTDSRCAFRSVSSLVNCRVCEIISCRVFGIVSCRVFTIVTRRGLQIAACRALELYRIAYRVPWCGRVPCRVATCVLFAGCGAYRVVLSANPQPADSRPLAAPLVASPRCLISFRFRTRVRVLGTNCTDHESAVNWAHCARSNHISKA